MKKNLLFLAAAAITLASCSSDETVEVNSTEANTVNFSANMNSTTRATSLALSDLESDGFYVTATYTSGGTAYFADRLFKLNSTTWEPYNGVDFTTKIYWPSSGNLDFHAYAPDDSQLSVSNDDVATENGCPAYTVTPDAAAADQVDFIYATLTNKAKGATLNLTFNHMESQVSIKLKNTDAALKFTVDQVAICNIAQSGIYKYRTTPSAQAWGDWGSVTNYTQGSLAISKNGAADAAVAGQSWILIPQTLAPPTTDGEYTGSAAEAPYNGAYIKVKMKVQSKADDSYYAGGSSTYVDAIWPISGTWAAGYHYTYTIDLSGGGYYELNTGTDADLKRVLDLTPITFASVTVSNWTASNSDVEMPY